MNSARLDAMNRDAIALDLETHLIQPGLVAPPIVCGSIAEPSVVEEHVGKKINLHGALLDKPRARRAFSDVLANEQYTLCGANIAYDLLCFAHSIARDGQGEDYMPDIFNAFDRERTIVRGYCDGRVFDVQMAESLHAIAQGELGIDPRTGKSIMNDAGRRGRYSLKVVTSQVLNRDDAKVNDRFRLRYAELEPMPIEEWPHEARTYPVDDAINTLEVALAQAGHLPSSWPHDWREVIVDGRPATYCAGCRQYMMSGGPGPDCMRVQRRRNLHDLSRQTYAWWALHLSSSWGFHVDQAGVDKLEAKWCGDRTEEMAPYVAAGLVRADGSENQAVLKKMVAVAYGATDGCPNCAATGKVPSEKTEGRTKVNCPECDASGYFLPPTVPRAPAGGIGKDRGVLQESGDELLMAYEKTGEGDKIKSTYIPLLRSARPCTRCGHSGYGKDKHVEGCPADAFREVPLIPRPNAIVETGRCSYEKGLHGLPRKGGVRECLTARPGYVFSSEDFTAGELVTHAQNCIYVVGYSKLAEALNLGLDAHLALAGTMTGRDYEEMKRLKKTGDKRAADDRQAAKAANFGFPGGMAELTFTVKKRSDPDLFTACVNGNSKRKGVVGYEGLRTCVLMDGAEACGLEGKVYEYNNNPCSPTCVACLRASKRLREFWFRQWPENNPRDGYFAIIKRLVKNVGPSGTAELTHHHTKRIRGGVQFTDGANGLFQGLLADAAKDAYCQITRECYDRTCRVESSEMMTSRFAGLESPLYGSRPILLAHDETIAEHPEGIAHEGATRISEIMVESLRWKCPNLKAACKADPTLMRKLYKGAEPRYARGGDKPADESDRLVCWEPN